MKKIFAFILASLMVLSLVPASAFAAVTNCPKTHTVAVCESLGISYSQVGNPVSPSCTSAGYTVYECDECGAQFLGDFVEAAGHTYVSDPKNAHKDVKADCTTQTSGKSHVICSVCHDLDQGIVIDVDWNKSHKLTKVAGSGVGCETLWYCSLCKVEGYKAEDGSLLPYATHTWEFVKVTLEPTIVNGVATNGEALYKCEVCGDTKTVPILDPGCLCLNLELIVAHVDATCEQAGTDAVYQCPDCLTLYVPDGNSFKELEDGDDEGDDVTVADAIKPAKGHTRDEDIEGILVGCDMTYFCSECEEYYTVKEHQKWQLVRREGQASCTSWGYEYYLCLACGDNWMKVLEPSGDHDTATATKKATCVEVGYKSVYCRTEGEYTEAEIANLKVTEQWKEWINYVKVKEVVGEDQNVAEEVYKYYKVVSYSVIPVDLTAHNIKNQYGTALKDYKADTTCGQYRVIIWTCHNPNCTTYGSNVELEDASAHNWKIWRETRNCEGTVSGGSIGKFEIRYEYKCLKCGEFYSEIKSADDRNFVFDSKEEARFYHGAVYKQYAYKSDGTLDKITYEEFRTGMEDIKAKGTEITPNCKATGYQEYECQNGCSGSFYVKLTSDVHVPNAKGWTSEVAATCEKTGTAGYYECLYCGVKFRYKGYTTYQYNANNGKDDKGKGQEVLTSLVINKHGSSLTKKNSDCGGVKYYECSCGLVFAKSNATGAYNVAADHHTWVYASQGSAATCNKDGELQIRWCSHSDCKRLEINALYVDRNGKVYTQTVHTATHTKEKTYEFDFEGVARSIKVAKNGKTYTDMGLLKESLVVSMLDHVAFASGTILSQVLTIGNATIIIYHAEGSSMLTPYDSSSNANYTDHSKANFTRHMCSFCGYEYLDNYFPATGAHLNRAGDVLTEECDNAVIEDRYCYICQTDIDVAHVPSETLTVPANCSTEGYTYWYCLTEGCGYRNVTGSLKIDKDVHEEIDYSIEANYGHDGYTYAVCALCGKTTKKATEVAAPNVAGVEITLSTEYDSYMPGSIVNVTVSLESLLGVDVWALRFPVTYDPTVYQYVGVADGSVADEFVVFSANNVIKDETVASEYDPDEHYVTDNKVAAGVISIVAQAEENVYVKGSCDLVTLQFKVIATEVNAETDSAFTVEVAEVSNPGTVKYSEVITWKNTTYPIEVVNEKAKSVKAMYNPENPAVVGENSVAPELLGFLDLDGDCVLTLADAKAIYALIIDPDADYTVLADADADGNITIADLNALYQIFTGEKTIEEILNPKTLKDIIGDRVKKYDSVTGEIIYDNYCDFNFDGVCDQTNEKACMTGSIDYKVIWESLGYDASVLD